MADCVTANFSGIPFREADESNAEKVNACQTNQLSEKSLTNELSVLCTPAALNDHWRTLD